MSSPPDQTPESILAAKEASRLERDRVTQETGIVFDADGRPKAQRTLLTEGVRLGNFQCAWLYERLR